MQNPYWSLFVIYLHQKICSKIREWVHVSLYVFPVLGGRGWGLQRRPPWRFFPEGAVPWASCPQWVSSICSELTWLVLFVVVYSSRYAVVSHCGLIWISLMTEDVVHFSCAYLLFICPIWRNVCSNLLGSFFIVAVFLPLKFESSLHILNANYLFSMCFA